MLQVQIQTVPTKFQIDTKPAKLEYTIDKGSYEWKARIGNYNMELEDLKYRQDSTEFRSSIGLKNNEQFAKEAAELGKQAAQESISRYVEIGNSLAKIHQKTNIPDTYYSYLPINKQYSLEVSGTAEIDWWFDPPTRDIEYQRKEFEFINYTPATTEFTYIPGEFSNQIIQYPEIHFNTVETK